MSNSTSTNRAVRVFLIALIVLIAASWAYLSAFGLVKDPHSSWETKDPSHTITAEEASALIGVPADDITVVWSTDYSTVQYPVIVSLQLSGLDGLPVYVFEYANDGWVLLTTQIAPLVDVTVSEDCSLSAVVAPEGSYVPKEDNGQTSSKAGRYRWLIATACITVAGIAYALASTRKKGL